MPLREGYFYSTVSFKLIEVYEHLSFLSELEAKVRTELGLTKEEKSFAKELGMKPGEGWGLIPREGKAENRERFLTTAMRHGWVRIRAHGGSGVYTFEADNLHSETLATLVLAVKQIGLTPATKLELHGITDNNAISLTVAELMEYAAGERPAAVGFSVWENPIGDPKSKVKLHQRGSLRDFIPYENPAGDFYTKYTGHFNATEGARLYGALQHNPSEISEYIDVEKEGRSVGRFFVGLTRGLGKKRGWPVDVEDVVKLVSTTRRKQLPKGLRGGATFITQRGFFTDWKAHVEHPDEDSLQVLVYPEFDGGEDLKSFESNMKDMARALADTFDQRSVVLDLEVNGKLKFLGEAKQ
jgi:hypothetical protein